MASSIRALAISRKGRPKAARRGPRSRFWRRFANNRLSLASLVYLIILLAVAAAGPWLFPASDTALQLGSNLLSPSREHLLGTDELGRDLLARLVSGTYISLSVGVASVSMALLVGIPVGGLAAYAGGWVDLILMRVIDILLTFPSLLTAIILVTILGPSLPGATVGISVTQMPIIARLMRALVLTLKDREFVTAARSIGVSDGRLLLRHILPNCVSLLLVQSSLLVASAILATAYLGFLGLGAQPPTPEWGAMVANGRAYLRTASHVALFPGVAIMVTVLALNAIGDGLRDAFDPQSGRATKG